MDSRKNPYNPGAGRQPEELAGRDDIIEKYNIELDRTKDNRSIHGIILYGLRGVGKTVLLNKVKQDAEAKGLYVAYIEAQENRSLPSVLIPQIRSILLRISAREALKDKVTRGLRVLSGFAKALKFKYQDIEINLDFDPEKGTADSGHFESDLTDLLSMIGETAKQDKTGVVITIDELQNVSLIELEALIRAFHHLSQNQVPVLFVGAGLPQILGQMGDAKSYAECLFEFIHIDKLKASDAKEALCKPAEREHVTFDDGAIAEILKETQGYPHFIQQWGKNSWDVAQTSPITRHDAIQATILALEGLDQSFFRVRFDRLTTAERKYVRAMAELGPGPHRSGDIAQKMNRGVSNVAPVRASLIKKGMIYSPRLGDTAFTAPLFDGFLKRTIPDFNGIIA